VTVIQPLDPGRERILLLTLAGIQFAHILDFMVMMPLGPILVRELAIGTHAFGLLVSSYAFSAAAFGVLAATFVDRFERKRLLLGLFALFGLTTLACGLAPGYGTLLAARCAAGAFGGVLGAMVQTMVGDLIIAQDAAGRIVNYNLVGWLAAAIALLAIALAGRIQVRS
jgi:predicted MFS family arabinose efflux permease